MQSILRELGLLVLMMGRLSGKFLEGVVEHFGCFFTRAGFGLYGTADDMDLCPACFDSVWGVETRP